MKRKFNLSIKDELRTERDANNQLFTKGPAQLASGLRTETEQEL